MYGLMLLLAIAACVGLTGRPLDAARRRLGPRPARRRLGCRLRDRRRARLPRHHELGRGARPLVGPVRRLAGRPRRLGRDPVRLHRRRRRHPPLRRERAPVRRRGRARAADRAGHRPLGQLVQPGALRQADRTCPGGWRSTSATGRRSTSLSDTFHPTFLYEFLYDLGMAGVLILIGMAVPDQAARPVRALRRLLHLRAHVRGAAAGRPVAPLRRRAAELLGLGCRLRVLGRRSSSGGSSSARGRPADGEAQAPRAVPKGPAMAVPKGRVRPRR